MSGRRFRNVHHFAVRRDDENEAVQRLRRKRHDISLVILRFIPLVFDVHVRKQLHTGKAQSETWVEEQTAVKYVNTSTKGKL